MVPFQAASGWQLLSAKHFILVERGVLVLRLPERPLLPEPLLVLKYILFAIVFLCYLAFCLCLYGKAVSQCSPTESCSSPGIADQFPSMELGVPVTLLQYQSIIYNPRIYLDIRRYETLIQEHKAFCQADCAKYKHI